MTPHSIPVFLRDATIGPPTIKQYPAIKGWDVFYTSPILVGFHVIGSGFEPCVPGHPDFIVELETIENYPKVVGFYAYGVGPAETTPQLEVIPQVLSTEKTPDIVGFHGVFVDNTTEESIFIAQIIQDNDAKVLGFYGMT
jgi:hypothetical protein